MEGDVIDAASAVHAADGCTLSRGGAETFVLERISLQWGFRRRRTGKGEKIEPYFPLPPACSRDLFQSPPGWGARMKSDVSEGSSHFHPVCRDLNKSPKEVKSSYWINPLFVTFSQTDLMLVRHHHVTLNPRQPPYVVRVKQGWMDG